MLDWADSQSCACVYIPPILKITRTQILDLQALREFSRGFW